MRVGDLIHGLPVTLARGAGGGSVRVCDLTEDSRTVMPGSLFVARSGLKSDGKAFVGQAVAAGAVAILSDDPALDLPETGAPPLLLLADDLPLATALLAERFYGSPSSAMKLIGVTGTNGKTTTTYLIHQILNGLGLRCGLIGTVVIDDGTEVAPAQLTTPPSLEISRTLGRMVEAGCRAGAMEVSSHALAQKRVAGLRFAAAGFTNLTHDHLDYHGTMEAYGAAKARLFEMLGPDAPAVVNGMDAWAGAMVRGCKGRVVRVGIGGANERGFDVRAEIVAQRVDSTDVRVHDSAGVLDVRLPLAGLFNVMNALQAAVLVERTFSGTGLAMGDVLGALERCSAPPGRLEPVTKRGETISVFVDYAHTDDALRTVLGTVRAAMGGGGRLWCVFGCGGDRDRTKRPRMGASAAELADRLLVTSDNPRTESPGSIIDEILAGVQGSARSHVWVEADRERAIRRAVREAEPGDAIVIAGKGHEDYQILPDANAPGGTVTRHFDDREVARGALAERGIVPLRPVLVRAGVEEQEAAEL